MRPEITQIAVSYTHLDVYKRQRYKSHIDVLTTFLYQAGEMYSALLELPANSRNEHLGRTMH